MNSVTPGIDTNAQQLPARTGADSLPARDERLQQLRQWLQERQDGLGLRTGTLRTASDDASFRRYFRLDAGRLPGGATTLIAMDAPPQLEDSRPFVATTQVLEQAGLSVPALYDVDLHNGFLLLEDLGTVTYGSVLQADTAPVLYADASAALIRLQLASRPGVFADYDRNVLLREMRLFTDWYLRRHRQHEPTEAETALIERSFDSIVEHTVAQPRVFVHRDYHCRNLMVLDAQRDAGGRPSRNPGVLDHQDALYGPITYDLVSLLRDAYVAWEEPQQIDWCIRHWQRARDAGLPVPSDFSEFYRDFEWMGLQRHLKVLGIFARLHHRDGKSRYLGDLPRVLQYVLGVTRRYNELSAFNAFLERIEGCGRTVAHTF